MGILLIILRWVGIISLSFVVLAVVLLGMLLFVPAKYSGEYKKSDEEDSLFLRFRISWLSFVVQYHFVYQEEEFSRFLRVFGIKIYPKKEKEQPVTENKPKKKSKKKINFFKRFKTLKNRILNKDNFVAVKIFLAELKKVFRHWGPRKLKANLSFCMGDPAYTGIVLGIISIFPIVYKEDVLLKSDFESDRIYLIGKAEFRGYLRAIHAVKMMFNLFSKKETRNIMSKFNK